MIEPNSLHLGDCLEVMKDIPDKSVDMILADLPYNKSMGKWDYIINIEKLWIEYKRIVKNGGGFSYFRKIHLVQN